MKDSFSMPKTTNRDPWWFFGTPSTSPDSIEETVFGAAVLTNRRVISRAVKIALGPNEFPSLCESLATKMPFLREVRRDFGMKETLSGFTLVSPQTCLQAVTYAEGSATVYFNTLSPEDDQAFLALNLYEEKVREKAEVLMITRVNGRGLSTRTITLPDRPLIKVNYDPETVFLWEKIRADLKAEVPRGRIAIFHGPPGTGKTHLIRGMIESSVDHVYLVIPPKEIGNLGDPEMANLLLQLTDDYEGRRIVLIVEDADEILSKRQATTMSALANTLSIGDGLLGDAINAFVVATTNAPLGEIDEAMKRPGRLSAIAEVLPLSFDQVVKILKNLAPDRNFVLETDRKMTLAEVYQMAREN